MIITLEGVLALLFACDPDTARGNFFLQAQRIRLRGLVVEIRQGWPV